MPTDNRWIIEQLNRHRPDREAQKGDREWQEPIIDELVDRINEEPPDQQDIEIRDLFRRQIRQVDGSQQRRANKYIKKAVVEGQPPLGWFELERMPVAVGEERVAVGSLSIGDVYTWRDTYAKENEDNYNEGLEFVNALDTIIDTMEEEDAELFARVHQYWFPDDIAPDDIK